MLRPSAPILEGRVVRDESEHLVFTTDLPSDDQEAEGLEPQLVQNEQGDWVIINTPPITDEDVIRAITEGRE